jgi:hypothetical protein
MIDAFPKDLQCLCYIDRTEVGRIPADVQKNTANIAETHPWTCEMTRTNFVGSMMKLVARNSSRLRTMKKFVPQLNTL